MWIDVSVPLDSPHPVWPTSPGVKISAHSDFNSGNSWDTELTMDVHCGTHVETDAHINSSGRSLESLEPDQLCGRVLVINALDLDEVPESCLPENLDDVVGILTRTENSERALMRMPDFTPDFVGWSVAFAKAVGRVPHLKFVGVDYLSIQPYGGDSRVHSAVLEAGVAVVEGLDLTDLRSGLYDMLGLFLALPSREAAPARVLLKPLSLSEAQ